MKALVIGGGGREHAIVWKLMQSRHVDKVYCMPGNAGIAEIAECIDVHSLDFNKLVDFVRYEWVDLTIVGPEGPLSGGIVDAFEREGRRIVGSTKMATQLESSKVFAKEFMKRYRIPTAEYKVFTSYIHAEEYVRMKGLPIVIKADGLAAGKGVFVASRAEEVVDALRLVMKERIFGDAGNRVIVEQYLEGEEVSFMAFTDGSTIIPMVSSQDYKRVFDNDEGPNTGGMGAYSPAPVITRELESIIMERIMRPAISGLKAMGIKYKGVLYAGLIIDNGNPYVLEFNCRFGDPEAQSILSRLNTDIMDISMAITDERLSDINIEWSDEAAVCVVLASEGYPGKYKRGKVIHGLNDVRDMDDVVVFHAGTAFNDNEIITKGGRVLGVTATGKDINGAKERSYEAVKRIHFEGMHYRKDIANKALNRQ
ncbi:phosphoribosylamine--glycine ligase [Thermodesulfovibrionales bacterium]|nr:phosphoribosylamine--glycine ligase [Thermodesulfovibrionales bacterium]MCL0035034.1 phosphoribosylamine--glycine ligase [Thermodesulfovibrionales bacterium]MCL0046754.1 phosphoribosylamine--glycine ligase [Thermodesulfovibrionales bacterium]MCL0096752.1 phosphoribosylamine--glycine ligase [Thermodesulfovibrionales bacterium]